VFLFPAHQVLIFRPFEIVVNANLRNELTEPSKHWNGKPDPPRHSFDAISLLSGLIRKLSIIIENKSAR
jgi:hypothetical protein